MTADPSSSSDPPVRPPRQERSRRTLDRIVRAALELFARQGVEGTSVQEIVDRADSSVGSFYARFQGKDALVDHLVTRVWDEARERWDEAVGERSWEELSLERLVEGIVELLVRLHRKDAGRRAALRDAGGRERRDPGDVADGREGGAPDEADGAPDDDPARAFHAHVEHDVTRLILAHPDRLGHPDPERAAGLGYHIAVAAILALLDEEEGDGAGDSEELSTELARCWLAYLGAEPYGPGAPEEDDVDFFDVWG